MAGMSWSVQPAAMVTVAMGCVMDGMCTRSVVVIEVVPGMW